MDFKKLNKKRKVNETLVTLPLVVLSPVCGSNEDAQKLWRFANIIDSCAGQNHHDKRGSTVSASSSTYYSSKEEELEKSEERLPKNKYNHVHPNTNYVTKPLDEKLQEHSSDCHLHGTSSHDHEETELKHYKKLETSMQHISRKMKSLENKLDKILLYLEKEKETPKDKNI